MTRTARAFFIVIIFVIASGCANQPVLHMEIYATLTPFPAGSNPFTATPAPLLNATATPGPDALISTLQAFTVAPAAMPSDFSPILFGEKYDANTFFFLLGGVQSGKWLTREQAASLFQGTAEYDVYTSAGETFQVLGYAPESAPIRPGQYTVATDVTYDQPGMLGVAHGWPVRLGEAQELSPDNEMYRQVVVDWLKEAGLSDPKLDTLQIVRVDVEGDGVDEIFLSATHADEIQQFTQAEDYSVVLMRKVVGNEAITLPVVADFYRPQAGEVVFPRTYRLVNFVDLNQDQTLEIIVAYHRWEEDGALLYTLKGGNIFQIP